MDSTWLVLLSLALGLLIGAGFVTLLQVAARHGDRAAVVVNPRVPDGVAQMLDAVDAAGVVLDPSNNVVKASPAALALGIVWNGTMTHPELAGLVESVRRTGEPVTHDVELARGPFGDASIQLGVRVARLGARYILLLADDHTESYRLEAVRRDFVANISHELKTPIAAVGILAEALEPAADDPQQVRRFAQLLATESARLSRITQDIIDLSRLQSTDAVANARPVSIADVVASAVEQNRVAAAARGIELAMGIVARGLRRQPDLQCDPLFTRSVAGRRGRSANGGCRRNLCHGSGRRHTGWRARPGLRTVLPRGSGSVAGNWWKRTRPGHCQARRSESRRRRQGLVAAGPRLHVHHPIAQGPTFARRPGGRCRWVRGSNDVTRILLVEDEIALSEPLAFLLRREGYEVTVTADGTGAIAAFESLGADLVLLDLMLPGMPGTEVCRRLRTLSSVPIIMLTAKDSEIDIVVGLELGADDYVTKPYSTPELLARIRAALRRHIDDLAADSVLEAGVVRMDVDRHTVSVRGVQTPMPLKEFELLEFLLRNSGRVLTRGQLIDRVWGSDYFGDTKTLDVHVKRIRSRIEQTPSQPRMLLTVRGLGYRFEGEPA
jgi:two-component system response regulator RegX3